MDPPIFHGTAVEVSGEIGAAEGKRRVVEKYDLRSRKMHFQDGISRGIPQQYIDQLSSGAVHRAARVNPKTAVTRSAEVLNGR
jgi:hypothetical protein